MKDPEKKQVHLSDVQQHASLLSHLISNMRAELLSWEYMEQRGDVEQSRWGKMKGSGWAQNLILRDGEEFNFVSAHLNEHFWVLASLLL